MAKKKKNFFTSLTNTLKKAANKSAANKKKNVKTQKKAPVVLDLNKTRKKTTQNSKTNKQNSNNKAKTTQKKSGLVLSEKKNQKQQASKQANQNLKKAIHLTKQKRYVSKETNPLKAAIDIGKNTTALGTKAEAKKEKYNTGLGVANAVSKVGSATAITGEATKQIVDEKKKLKKQGYDDTQIKEYEKRANKQLKSLIKEQNKSIDKNLPKELEYSYKGLTQQEYNQLATASQTGQLNSLLKSDKELAKKVADLNVKDYVKGAFSMGALDQLTQGLSVSENPVYDYSKSQKQIMERQKESKAYNAGRMAGAVGEFALSGTGTLGSAMFKTAGKTALKEAAKSGGKNLAKTTAKNIGKEVAGDTIASLGLNTLDALKFSYKDGEFDKKAFGKELALNVAGDILIGGAVSGLTHGLSAKQVSNFNRINNTLKNGGKVSDAELKFYNKHVEELADKVEGKIEKQNSIIEEPRVTKVKNPYQGRTPVQTHKKTGNINVKSSNIAKAREIISLANGNKSEIKKAYQNSLDNLGNSKVQVVKDVSFKGEPYEVSVGKKVIGKVVSDKNLSVEKLAILDEIENVIAEGKYVGSGEYIPHGNKKKHTERFDYFETDVTIDGKSYVVSFDVEVFPNVNNYRTHQITKIDLTDTSRAGVGPEPTAGEINASLSTNNIYNSVENVNAKELELQKANGETFEEAAAKAVENPGKQYDTPAERIKNDNLNAEQFYEKAKRISTDEIPEAKQTAIKLVNQASDDVADIMEPWVRNGLMDKKVLQSQEEAIKEAEKELADGRLYQNFMDSKVEKDEHLFMARAKVLLEDLMNKATTSDEATEQLLKVMEKSTEASSHAARLLNATKLLLRNTPEGRVRIIAKEVEALNKKYKNALKGKEIKLTTEQINKIKNATDETIEDIAQEINQEVWEQVPVTWFEKFNELRHSSMLFNPKTHIRNVVGNTVFAAARNMSDALEVAAYHLPVVKKRLEKFNGKTNMVRVTRSDVAKHNDVLNEIFDTNYGKSNSKQKYVESSRPNDSPIIKNKAINKVIQTNYGLLEKEDLLMFKPAYKKNYVRWCKANDIDLSDISKMTKEQMQKADAYAIKQAEYATFRDNSAFAQKIVGLKEKTATKKGQTVIGTAAYRTANVALESNLPFVKTPVNVLRRSMDFSPIGLGRSMVELATAKNADMFMQGVHHMATGLTGSGVCALGMLLANNDLITLRAGGESGDEYYDRDMGYQDYSLVLKFGDKKYSVTIDWLSPMQTSLFMGAAMYNSLSEKGYTAEDMFDCLAAVTGPMLDMSFMSSAKDTFETFMEKVFKDGTGDESDWSGAVMQTLFGSIPQGYLNSFVPQIVNQTAQAFDNKQRDTRSTKEGPLAASWDSWKKKLINKIPGLRNKLLNPKLDRFGNDKTTGNNIVTRLLQSYLNPSNVKEINLTKLDKEIISIYNHMKDGDNKKYFFYNFTGNPSYELNNGNRMTYNEAYKYGKSKRIEQTTLIEQMVNAKRYENMTWDMKADEINSANWISQTKADLDVYGANYATEKILSNKESKTEQAAYKKFQAQGGKNEDYVGFYLEKEKLIAQCHDSSFYTKAIAAVKYGNNKISKAYGIYGDKIKATKEYFKKGGSEKEYSNSMCNVISTLTKNNASTKMANKAVAAAINNINKRTCKAMGLTEEKANMGVGLINYKYDFEKLEAMEIEALISFDEDNNNSLKKEEIIDYIDSLGLETSEEKACVFRYFSDAKNPYGEVPDYMGFGTSSSSGGGYSKKSKSSSKSSNLPSWENYVADYLSSIEEMSGVKFKKWDSPLDQAYRNKINSINKKREA